MAPIALAIIFFGGWLFVGFMVGLAVLMVWEWDRLIGGEGVSPGTIVQAVSSGGAVISASYLAIAWMWAFLALGLVGAVVWSLAKRRSLGWHLLGVPYVVLPCVAAIAVRLGPADGLWVFVGMLLVIWATDIGAYFAGRGIGGPKLAPKVSPNKTWAGLGGGMVAAAIVTVILAATGSTGITLDPVSAAVLGAVMAVLAQAGDLAESAIKRHFGVKDSSNLIPGHGGILDRLDGFLLVAPMAAVAIVGFGVGG